jgi:hypothetical protein
MDAEVRSHDGSTMSPSSDAQSSATTPNVPALEAEMCPNLPPPAQSNPIESAQTCPDLPPLARSNPAEPAQTCPHLPEPAPGERENAGRGTNPIRDSELPVRRPLSDKQLAAARWVVCGHGSKAIARQLGVNHHTVGVWKRDPRFVALVAELRARADASAVAMTARSQVVAAGGSPRSGSSAGSSSANANRGLPPAATTNPPRGAAGSAGSVTERLLAQIMQRRDRNDT